MTPRTGAICARGGRKEDEKEDECRKDIEEDMFGIQGTRKGARDDCEETITAEEEMGIGETEVKADEDEMRIVTYTNNMIKSRV